MKRRAVLVILVASTIACPIIAGAQHRPRPLIGILDSGSSGQREPLWRAFRERLSALGYADGRDVSYELRFAEDQRDRVKALAEELVARRVDVIVTAGTLSGLAAKAATKQIPIVLATGGDPVLMGLVAGLAEPGGNITGVTTLTELGVKRLELLRELLPGISRVAVLWNLASPSARRQAHELKEVAPTLGLSVELVGIGQANDLEPAFARMTADRLQGVLVITSPLFFDQRERLAMLALQHRLPMALGFREYAEAGALAAYGSDLRLAFRRAADYVDRILKGAKPSELPIEQPTSLTLILNLRTAKALGLSIPPTLLARADEVIE